jgi:hypothetical protein
MSKYHKPNFLIVGAARAGTTSLAKYLNEHPEVFVPENKELRFFIADIIKTVNKKDPQLKEILKQSILDEEKYFKEFEVPEKLAGEASVHYLYHHKTVIPKIKEYVGDIPIIIILRNPVERAISNWQYTFWDNNSFKESLSKEDLRIKMNFNSFWYYKDLGFYYEQVKDYLDSFSNVKIIIFEEFKKDVQGSMNEIFDFLKIHKIQISKKIYNKREGISPRYFLSALNFSHRSYSLILKLFKYIGLKKVFFTLKSKTIDPNIKELLKKDYLSDIINLEKLLKKDLTSWKIF